MIPHTNQQVDHVIVPFHSIHCRMFVKLYLLLMDKTKLNRRLIYDFRCDERLNAKAEGSIRLA